MAYFGDAVETGTDTLLLGDVKEKIIDHPIIVGQDGCEKTGT